MSDISNPKLDIPTDNSTGLEELNENIKLCYQKIMYISQNVCDYRKRR